MIDHVGINCADYAGSQRFYDAVLGTLGFSRQLDVGRAVGLGAEPSPASGRCSRHAPRFWPEYHPGYFGGFVRDPDGNNVEAVFHGTLP